MSKIVAVLIVVIVLIVAFARLTTSGRQTGGPDTSLPSAYKEISIDEFRARRQANPLAKVVDVRTEAEYRAGHIEGAIVIPLDQFRAKAGSLLNRNDEILLYCHDGPMGSEAAIILTQQGYTNVANMRGGINQWIRQGLPITK